MRSFISEIVFVILVTVILVCLVIAGGMLGFSDFGMFLWCLFSLAVSVVTYLLLMRALNQIDQME